MKSNGLIYLPSTGNNITRRDLDNGKLRITVHAKYIFPDKDCDIRIKIGNKKHTIKFTKRQGRSDIIHIGKDIISALGLTTKSIIFIEKIGDKATF